MAEKSHIGLTPLPIDPLLPEIVAQVRAAGRLVLLAPPGAGKTTRVPSALLDAGLAGDGRIVVLQPRRLAARAAAARIAAERNVELGAEIGYQVRFESRVGRGTRLAVVTEGILIRMLADDPFLDGVSIVVFDEFHERSLHSDLALAMVRRVRQETRPDLKIVVMSATLDVGPMAEFLGESRDGEQAGPAPVIVSEGRAWPVDVSYLPHEPTGKLEQIVTGGVEQMAARSASGDMLVFLPGVGEIRRVGELLAPLATREGWTIAPLYGEMPLAEQQAAMQPGGNRKIVLATNVAETSLTIEGVTAVVDSGWARQMRADPETGINRLSLVRISQASAEQRAGRAGRTGPGACLRLWTQRRHHGLEAQTTPEIRRVDLAGAALELLCWGERDLGAFPWFERPPAAQLVAALALLEQLGAAETTQSRHDNAKAPAADTTFPAAAILPLQASSLGPQASSAMATELGRRMARQPLHPRLARLMIEGQRLGAAREAALAAALLSERDPWPRAIVRASPAAGGAKSAAGTRAGHWSDSDVVDRVKMLEEFDRGRRLPGGGDPVAARHVLRVAADLEREIEWPRAASAARRTSLDAPSADIALRQALLAAFPDRVCRRREPHSERGVMVGGRGVRLDPASAVREAELFVAVEVQDARGGEALAPMASAIEREWLCESQLSSTVEVEFDAQRERVVAWRRVRWRDLMLEEAATSVPADVDVADVLAAAARERLQVRDWLDERAERLLARVAFLRQWLPDLTLPDWSDERLLDLLPRLCAGCVSFAELKRRSLEGAILETLSGAQRAAFDSEAPERLRVPSGSQIALEYAIGKTPTLAVRIQEVFGWTCTPRLAAGRAPVLLHLLAPNMRPQQITDDLASFWAGAYAEVRKELRRRYPKHAWPEDPSQGRPERRPGKR